MNSFLDKMRSWIPAHAPEWVFKASMAVWEAYKNLTMPEQKKSFGNKNPDKTFFVIRLYPPAAGFLADYNYVLGYMKYAYDNGWIPVVDMQNYQTLYNEDHPIHGTTLSSRSTPPPASATRWKKYTRAKTSSSPTAATSAVTLPAIKTRKC